MIVRQAVLLIPAIDHFDDAPIVQMNFLFFILAALSSSSLCNSARILALLPVNSRSHFIVMEPLLMALQKRGHHLTVVSSFPQKYFLQNYTYIDLSAQVSAGNFSLQFIRNKMSNPFNTPIFYMNYHRIVCEHALKNDRVLNLIKENFDLAIGEMFGSNCFNYVFYKLRVPFINWVVSTPLPWIDTRFGIPDNPSYIPNFLMDYSSNLTIFQRVFNTVILLYAKTTYFFFSDLSAHKLAEESFGEHMPMMNEVNQQTSLILFNSHFTLSQSRPLPPNAVEVGGIHIKDRSHLPEDLEQLLDGAEDGALLVSFGSLVRMSSLPPQVIRMFLDVFSTLPQRVIFKYETELEAVPSNVFVRKWVPQSDIIAHPNVRAVISHGGQASTIEAVYFGKPLVVIPFFGDQYQNAKNVVRRGVGLMLDIDNLSQRDITYAVKTIMNDTSYTENMRRLSQQFRDRPMTPLQTAVYWTEYVIRHQGAPHLRPASVSLPLYQYLLLDVIAILVISLVAVFLIIYKTVNLVRKGLYLTYMHKLDRNKKEI
ncbi:UDP-glucosyltransferase 2-like [Homalodisca vitripennis]|uniref:UDP-glucosyltransferase 2-like n=1 Tax=Homalodisca vitripennis TaxID=197043 RepID=UPI001EEB020A|nr:UDP-glucosyltransferase 2-like [Homalodisca vitripennis]